MYLGVSLSFMYTTKYKTSLIFVEVEGFDLSLNTVTKTSSKGRKYKTADEREDHFLFAVHGEELLLAKLSFQKNS